MGDSQEFLTQSNVPSASHQAALPAAVTGATNAQSTLPPSTAEAVLLGRLQIVTDVALSHLSLEELEHDLLNRIRDLLGGDIAMMLLLSDDEQYLSMSASSGIQSEQEKQASRQIRIPIGRGVAGRIALERKPIIFADLEDVEVLNPLLREKGVRSLVGAPLLIQERLIGVIYIGTTHRHAFTDEDTQLLQLVGDRFAIAIERARLYEAVRDAEIRKGAILEAALDCILMMNDEGIITEFNPAAERTFGYTRTQAIGQPLADLIIPPALREAHNRGLQHFLKSGQGPVINQRIEITGMRSDGTEFPVELTVIPLVVQGRMFFTGYLRDITQRKQAEAEREHLLAREKEARSEAEAANRAKDEFLSMLSHELRTPLTPMLGWAQMLLTHKLDEAASEAALQSILRNVKTQARLVEDLLDVSRIITGKLDVTFIPLELEPVILEAISTVRPEAEAKGISLRTVLDAGAGTVLGDSHRLLQIIWNLLSNAIKFTPQGGHIEVCLERAGMYAQIQVRDNGTGISAEFLPYVFERLRQADSSSTRPYGGLGLGLAIVRHLVELHHGEVRAESAGSEQGAVFTVKLPLQPGQTTTPLNSQTTQGDESPPSDEAADTTGIFATLKGLKVLVVDDEADVRQLAAAVLEHWGASVTQVASTTETLALLPRLRPDVIVSDIGMPGEDGYTLIRKVRALAPHQGGQTPAIALTAYAGTEDRRQALEAGYQSHLTKPVDPTTLAIEVARLSVQRSGDGATQS